MEEYNHIPAPWADQEAFTALCKKYGKDLADALYHQHFMHLILEKLGPIEITQKEWDEFDPEEVFTVSSEKSRLYEDHYRFFLVVDKNVESKIQDKNKEYYALYSRVDTEPVCD
jgi:hypothetical protein